MKKDELRAKGWHEEDIALAEGILKRGERHDVFFARMVFWSALLVIVFANIAVTAVLVPFLAFFEPGILYVTVVFLAAMVGFVYNFLINDVEHLERKHHLLAGILVPLIALGNVVLMVVVSEKLFDSGEVTYNPIILGLVFAAAFIAPYVLDRIRLIFRRKTVVA
jgi:hypothetical protein